MNFIQNAIKNLQTTLLGLAPIAVGGYMVYQGYKAKNVQQILTGVAALSGGGIGLAASDGNKGGAAQK